MMSSKFSKISYISQNAESHILSVNTKPKLINKHSFNKNTISAYAKQSYTCTRYVFIILELKLKHILTSSALV